MHEPRSEEERHAPAVVQADDPAHACLQSEGGKLTGSTRATLRVPQLLSGHGGLSVTPAMEAGVADHLWDLSELSAA